MPDHILLRTKNIVPGIRLVESTLLLMGILLLGVPETNAQATCPFATCGNGTDGALNYTGRSGSCGTVPNCIYFDPVALGLKGTGDAFCVYNFTSITIPAGLTILLSQYKVNCPVYWLSQGDVNIAGTLSLAGQYGTPTTYSTAVRVPAPPGSGGFAGGVGGNSTTGQNPTAGSGPGGGAAGTASKDATGGKFSGNSFLVPLVGGSGGGGCVASGQFGPGGAAGGGAILIASSTQIIVSGKVTADGGAWSGTPGCVVGTAGNGSGGAIRLVSITISGSGTISSEGWSYGADAYNSTAGYVRLEANTISFAGSFNDIPNSGTTTNVAESNPLPLFVPSAIQSSVQVTKIDGFTITAENPFSFPDVTINTGSQVPVVITGHNVPLGTIPYLYVYSDTQDQQAIPCTGGLTGTLATSTCTMNIAFPFADSRGFVKASWSSTPP